MLLADFYDYSDAYIVVNGTTTTTEKTGVMIKILIPIIGK